MLGASDLMFCWRRRILINFFIYFLFVVQSLISLFCVSDDIGSDITKKPVFLWQDGLVSLSGNSVRKRCPFILHSKQRQDSRRWFACPKWVRWFWGRIIASSIKLLQGLDIGRLDNRSPITCNDGQNLQTFTIIADLVVNPDAFELSLTIWGRSMSTSVPCPKMLIWVNSA